MIVDPGKILCGFFYVVHVCTQSNANLIILHFDLIFFKLETFILVGDLCWSEMEKEHTSRLTLYVFQHL
jgi:hypothetical protein